MSIEIENANVEPDEQHVQAVEYQTNIIVRLGDNDHFLEEDYGKYEVWLFGGSRAGFFDVGYVVLCECALVVRTDRPAPVDLLLRLVVEPIERLVVYFVVEQLTLNRQIQSRSIVAFPKAFHQFVNVPGLSGSEQRVRIRLKENTEKLSQLVGHRKTGPVCIVRTVLFEERERFLEQVKFVLVSNVEENLPDEEEPIVRRMELNDFAELDRVHYCGEKVDC